MWDFDIQGLRHVLLCLSGCSSYQTDFDCEVERGIPCTSLSDISRLIDEGKFEEAHSKKALKPDHAKEEPCCGACATSGDACAEKRRKTPGTPASETSASALRELVLVNPAGGIERYEI